MMPEQDWAKLVGLRPVGDASVVGALNPDEIAEFVQIEALAQKSREMMEYASARVIGTPVAQLMMAQPPIQNDLDVCAKLHELVHTRWEHFYIRVAQERDFDTLYPGIDIEVRQGWQLVLGMVMDAIEEEE